MGMAELNQTPSTLILKINQLLQFLAQAIRLGRLASP
jgi:hypothetical protein